MNDILNKSNKSNKNNIWIFFLFTILAFCMHSLNQLELFKYTFKPVEVLMHEGSHLITSLLFGGKIVGLNLQWDSGSVTHATSAFAQPLVSFAGYFGASFFGFLIYYSSLHVSKYLKFFLIAYCSFFFIYVDGLQTALILSLIILLWVACWKLGSFGCYLLRFIGIYVMVSSIYSPTYLFAYTDTGDHISLSEQTLIPSILWIACWFVLGIFFMYRAFRVSIDKKIKK